MPEVPEPVVDGITNVFAAVLQSMQVLRPLFHEAHAQPHPPSSSSSSTATVKFCGAFVTVCVRFHVQVEPLETDFSDSTLCDLVGEVANTISGNARRDFGREFVISVPSVLTGDEVEVPMTRDLRPYVIPINWRSHSAKLVVALK